VPAHFLDRFVFGDFEPGVSGDMQPLRTIGAAFLIAGLAVSLAGCKDTRTGQPLVKEKGVYQGTPDTPLDAARLKELRQRSHLQGQGAL
jgi:hypothetical protein